MPPCHHCAPPELGSERDRADLAEILKAQDTRSSDQIASIKTEAEFKIQLITMAIGNDLKEKDFPLTWSLLVKADLDVMDVYHRARSKWQRQRPFRAHDDVKNIVDANGFGYPSGHSTRSATLASILRELFPGKKTALQARSAQIAGDRVSGGEHYPSDIDAGQKKPRTSNMQIHLRKKGVPR